MQWGLESHLSWAQLMKGGAHPSPFAALSFLNSKKVPMYCWVDRESFPVAAWRGRASNSRFTATFCTVVELLQPLDHDASLTAPLYIMKFYMLIYTETSNLHGPRNWGSVDYNSVHLCFSQLRQFTYIPT